MGTLETSAGPGKDNLEVLLDTVKTWSIRSKETISTNRGSLKKQSNVT